MAAHKTGGEIDAFCNKCKMALAHTILAMVGEKVVRVQCNTCGSQHMYRGTAPGGAAAKPRAASSRSGGGSSAAVSKITQTFEALLAEKHTGTAKKYSPKETYAKDEVIDHPTFGFGVVLDVRGDKVNVLFKMAEKTLVHGRGGAPAARPTYSPPVRAAHGPADKPMTEEEAQVEAAAAEAAEAEQAGPDREDADNATT